MHQISQDNTLDILLRERVTGLPGNTPNIVKCCMKFLCLVTVYLLKYAQIAVMPKIRNIVSGYCSSGNSSFQLHLIHLHTYETSV